MPHGPRAMLQTDLRGLTVSAWGFPFGDTGDELEPCSRGEKRVKKHPSPSKRTLEDLETAFQRYGQLQRSGADQDELDELARTYASPTPALVFRDPNRMMTERSIIGTSSPSSRIRATRIPQPTDFRREMRVAPPYRPTVPHADESDELQ